MRCVNNPPLDEQPQETTTYDANVSSFYYYSFYYYTGYFCQRLSAMIEFFLFVCQQKLPLLVTTQLV